MKIKDWSVLVCGIFCCAAFVGCKKEKGERGPTGAGVSFSRYEGTFSTPSFEFDAPDLTIESFLQVRVSSNSINWEDAFCGGDYAAKQIGCFTTLDAGEYKAILQNPA